MIPVEKDKGKEYWSSERKGTSQKYCIRDVLVWFDSARRDASNHTRA